ncbi:hypothetical protein KNT89_gp81 [Gordonia phage Petra]|uniref:Uncharacterized protein n=2 Tax=root TaxID=1 RepID=A0A2U8UKD8_9CAUD|nr:hypothetical protein [Gordonia westfalica]YP_010095475.1 hypothetical protein KNT89_gp81 [Gordonia phage Petra]AWN04194.1 hypothetical protein PBI_PETRA_81 [Gordonia phage Petra]SDU64809.1 hypothetical protein SAMN04488548_1342954 [Gordonia westfalica]
MTVAELIEKLSALPPSTVVATDSEFGYDADVCVYQFRANVERRTDGSTSWMHDDNGRDSIEPVVLITHYGHDDKEQL